MTHKTWRQRCLEPLAHLLRGETSSRRPSTRRPHFTPRLEELEARLSPATTFSIANNSVIEPASNGTVNLDFTVTRSGDLTSQVTVAYTTIPGTAKANTDFTPTTGATTFAYGASSTTIAIPIFGNGVFNNPSLTFSVQLTGVTNVVGPPVTLAAPSGFDAGGTPDSVAVGDLNGDGKPDLVVADTFGAHVSVLLNTTAPGAAAPTFAPKMVFTTGVSPFSVAIGDLNGDGRADLVVANKGDNTVSVLLNITVPGAAAPTFAPHVDFTTGLSPFSVAVGDLNGDGKPDLVVANISSQSVSVLLNTTTAGAAAPTFAPKADFTTGVQPYSVAVGDLNGDGKLDLVVANKGANSVSVLLNTTTAGAVTPTFAPKVDFTTGTGPLFVAVADLNGDGKPDLAVANPSANSLSVLLNTTMAGAVTPTFASKVDFATRSYPPSVAVADLNGDGKPDLVVANYGTSLVSVLLNTTTPGAAAPSFAARADFAIAGITRAVAIADLNGDGKPDLAIANLQSNSVSVLLNTTAPGATAPTFANKVDFTTGTSPRSVAVADLNGDGKPDLVVTGDPNSVSVLVNTTTTGATSPTFANKVDFTTGSKSYSVAVADLNGDGRPDLVVANYATNSVSVLLNTTMPGAATPTFAPEVDFTTGLGPVSVTIADLNGDGMPDLVVANISSQSVSVLLSTTTAGATAPSFAPKVDFTTGSNPFSVAVADLNGDGKPDLVVVNESSSSNSVSVLLNTTTAGATTPTFASKVDFATGSNPFSVAVADLDGDGRPDLVVANKYSNSVSVLLNTTGAGAAAPTFVPKVDFTTGTKPRSVAVADLNGDGRPDFAVANSTSNTVSVLLNTPDTITIATATGTITESDPEPTVSFAVATQSVNENGGAFTVTVTLSAISGSDTTIPFTLGGTAVNGTDYSGVTTSPLVIVAGQTTGTITGTLIDDGKFNTANKTLTLTLGAPTNATVGANGADTITINESDPKPTVSFASATQTVNENGGGFTVTVTLSAVAASDTTVPFALGGTAVSGADYNGVTLNPLVIAAGQISGAITGTLIDDGKFNTTNKTLTFTLGNPTGAILSAPTTDTLTVVETDSRPTVSFASATQSVNENAGTFSVPLILSAASSVDTTVPFTLSGAAVNVNGSVVILAGQTTGAITGTLIDDGKFNTTNTTLTLTLGAPTNATLGSTTTNTLTVVESDPKPMVSFASATQSVNENGAAFTVTVNLSAASGVDTTIPFTLGGTATAGTDYSGVTMTPLVIKAGQIGGTVTGVLLDDGAPDAVKTLTLTLGTPTNATLGATTTDTLTIADALPPPPPPPPVQPSLPPSVSVAFGPTGEVLEVVNSAGVLTQYDATGAHVLGGGVRSASIAFGPFGEVLEVVGMNGVLTQFDATGAHQLGGAGVESASIAFGPGGQVSEVVLTDGSLRQFSTGGVQVLAASGVRSASVAFGPFGEVVDIVSTAGILTQFDASGVHQLGGAGVQSASVAFTGNSLVLDIIFADGTLDQFDAFGVHRLGMVV